VLPTIARMTENESRWAARVEAWRTSGETAPDFCQGKEFSPGGLRYWASRLKRGVQGAPRKRVHGARVARRLPMAEATEASKEVRGARVVRRPPLAEATETPKEVRLARVVRGRRMAEAPKTTETPILIEVGHARVGVRRGFDAASLRVVLDILGGGR
jgi:transposase